MAVKPTPETADGWVTLCRATAVVGAGLVGVAGVAASLDFDESVNALRVAGVVLALAGWGAEVVLSGLAAPIVAALALAPVGVAAVAWAWARGTGDDVRAANEQTATAVALAAPFVAAAVRSLGFQAASTWHVGFAGALLMLQGGAAVAVVGGIVPDAVTLLFLAGVLLVAYAASDRQNLGDLAASRQVRYGGGSLVLVALFAALSIGGYALARRNDRTFDWTRSKAFTLSDHSVRVASGLAFDVEVKAFYRTASVTRRPFEDLIHRFVEANPRIAVEWIDPLSNPLRAKEALVSGDHGVVVLTGNGKERRLEGEITEEELARELSMLASTTEHLVCWIMGHGEPDPDDDLDPSSFGGVRTELERLNYKVVPVRTAQEGLPQSCEVALMVRPNVEPLPYEREALAAYVAGGGRAFVLVDVFSHVGEPFDVPDFTAELERFGVSVGNDIVVDLNQKHQMLDSEDPTVVLLSAQDFGTHAVTRNLAAAVVLPGARSVRFRAAEGLEGMDLLRTSPDAWGETTPGQPGRDDGVELTGEVPVMAVVEVKDPAVLKIAARAPEPAPESPPEAPPESVSEPIGLSPRPVGRGTDVTRGVPADFAPVAGGKLVVSGDSDFASNAYLGLGNNRDLFLNVVAWLAEEPDQIGERPEAGETLEISEAGESVLCLVTVLVIPGIVITVAGGILLRRRNL